MRGCDLIKVYPAKFTAFHRNAPRVYFSQLASVLEFWLQVRPSIINPFPRSLRAAILSRVICWVAISQSLPTPRLTPLIPLILPRFLKVSNKCHTVPGSIGYRPASPYRLLSTFCVGCELPNLVSCCFVILTCRGFTQDILVCYQKR